MSERDAFKGAQITFTENGQQKCVPLRAPYAFVPAGNKVLAAPDAPRLDRPLPGAVSGRLKIRITAETPILVGGTDTNDSPARAPDGRWTIPGTSLRGMLRAVLESAAFARMSFVDDCATATRDFGDPTWKENVNISPQTRPNGGWLFITRDGWKLVPAKQTEKVPFDKVLPWVDTDDDTWHAENMHARLTRLAGKDIAGLVNASAFSRSGRARLVVAGPTAEGDNKKKHEHLFFWPDHARKAAKPIDARTGERFVTSLARDANTHTHDANTHTDDPETNYSALTAPGRTAGFEANWQNWRRNRRQEVPSLDEQIGKPDHWALPVFWRNRVVGDNGNAQRIPTKDTILSLTAFLRVPYENSLKDILAESPKPDPAQANDYDLVQALFGWAAPDVNPDTPLASRNPQERALRSRVRFGFLLSDSNATNTLTERTWAATRPRASFWPYYLRPGDDNATHPVDFDNPKAIVAGRKRYPARGEAREELPHFTTADGLSEEQVAARNSTLHFLPAGTTFCGEIRLHNVTQIELGALLWALTFGQIDETGAFADRGYRHMLGRARTWGYGQIRLELLEKDTKVTHILAGDDAGLAGAVEAFKEWVCDGLGVDRFEDIETIRRLLNTAHAATGAALNARLRFPAVGGDDSTGDNIVKGYTQIRKAAQNKGREKRPAPRDAKAENFVGLPPYPRADST